MTEESDEKGEKALDKAENALPLGGFIFTSEEWPVEGRKLLTFGERMVEGKAWRRGVWDGEEEQFGICRD